MWISVLVRTSPAEPDQWQGFASTGEPVFAQYHEGRFLLVVGRQGEPRAFKVERQFDKGKRYFPDDELRSLMAEYSVEVADTNIREGDLFSINYFCDIMESWARPLAT